MKRSSKAFIALASASLLAAAAPATEPTELNLGKMTPGFSYFNKPFADVKTHNDDVAACLVEAAKMRSFEETIGYGAGALTAMLESIKAGAATRGTVLAALENCMVVRGWRVVHLDDVEGAALAALPAADLMTKLTPWIGAETPHGEVVRVWHNDAALGAVNHFSLNASHNNRGQLSLLAAATTPSAVLKANREDAEAAKPTGGKIVIDPKWSKKKLKPEMLDSAPEGSTIFIVNVTGFSMRQGNGFLFNRMGPDADTAPSALDHGTDHVEALASSLAGGDKHFMAFAVPPGRWRITGMWSGGITLNFCLGAPAFDLKAGEVVYAGKLDMKQEKLAPDLSLGQVTIWAGAAKAAARIKPASWVNGTSGACTPNSIYALEFDGVPFEDGYGLGSKVPVLRAAP
jgi:hypothetical protein